MSREAHPYGLTLEQAQEAFAWYFTEQGKAELQYVLLRDYARELGDIVKPLPGLDETEPENSHQCKARPSVYAVPCLSQ